MTAHPRFCGKRDTSGVPRLRAISTPRCALLEVRIVASLRLAGVERPEHWLTLEAQLIVGAADA